MKSTQNHLTLEHIGVELWVSGRGPPSRAQLNGPLPVAAGGARGRRHDGYH